jgi:hypothetical protein
MTIQSTDQLVAAFTGGQSFNYAWNKVTGAAAYTAGRAYETFSLGGLPVATTFPGTALTWKTCDETTGDGTNIFGMPHGGNVSALIKNLINMSAWTTAATGVPGTLILVDLQGYYPGIDMNTLSAQTLLGTPTLRYTNGVGCNMFLAARATTGATAHNITMSYTNTAGTAGRALGATVAATPSAIVPHILHSGTAANNYGPYLPLAGGDTGLRSVQTVTLSAASGTASTAVLCIVKELARITLAVNGMMSEKDLLNQIPSMPVIRDGACLGWIYLAGAATAASTTFAGNVEGAWG